MGETIAALVQDTEETEQYTYYKTSVDGMAFTLNVRIRKQDDQKMVCLNDFVAFSIKNTSIDEFLKYPNVVSFYNEIEFDSYKGLYYSTKNTTDRIFKLLLERGKGGSSLDWNVTAPRTLTIKGAINAEEAQLGGFWVDNEKIQSIKEDN